VSSLAAMQYVAQILQWRVTVKFLWRQ